MKTLKNKKGFTIVELVIVIAVIAILAAVLIPTFSGVVEKANESKRVQAARNAYTSWLAEGDGKDSNALNQEKVIAVKVIDGGTDYWYKVDKGSVTKVNSQPYGDPDEEIYITVTTGNESISQVSAESSTNQT